MARRRDGSVVAWGKNRYGQCNVPSLLPGQTCVELAGGYDRTVALVQSGSYTTFGRGCGSATLTATAPPRVGQTLRVTLGYPRAGSATLLVGASSTTSAAGPLPIWLGFLGLSGCWLRVSPDVALPKSHPYLVTFILPIPATPALIGQSFFQQAVVDPIGPGGFTMSDAVAAVIGS